MSQKYEDIPVNEYVYNSLQKLLDRDDTGATFGAGTSFPDVVEDWQVGKTCLRTDEKVLYYLSSVNPVKWDVIVDFSKPFFKRPDPLAKMRFFFGFDQDPLAL